MYHTTGLSRERIMDLCALIHAGTEGSARSWPPIPGLFRSVVVTLTELTPTIARLLISFVPTADEVDGTIRHIVDGTLLPCWSWASRPDLYSGKRRTTGMNVQVACTLDGRIAWISDPIPGSRHDTHRLGDSDILAVGDPANWIGDKGYIGNRMITPIRKPACRDLLDWEKEFNTQVNRIRWIVERAIANLKTWRILHTDYRRPITTFATTISAAIALHFYTAP